MEKPVNTPAPSLFPWFNSVYALVCILGRAGNMTWWRRDLRSRGQHTTNSRQTDGERESVCVYIHIYIYLYIKIDRQIDRQIEGGNKTHNIQSYTLCHTLLIGQIHRHTDKHKHATHPYPLAHTCLLFYDAIIGKLTIYPQAKQISTIIYVCVCLGGRG